MEEKDKKVFNHSGAKKMVQWVEDDKMLLEFPQQHQQTTLWFSLGAGFWSKIILRYEQANKVIREC